MSVVVVVLVVEVGFQLPGIITIVTVTHPPRLLILISRFRVPSFVLSQVGALERRRRTRTRTGLGTVPLSVRLQPCPQPHPTPRVPERPVPPSSSTTTTITTTTSSPKSRRITSQTSPIGLWVHPTPSIRDRVKAKGPPSTTPTPTTLQCMTV